jgi:SH3 domain-containing protein
VICRAAASGLALALTAGVAGAATAYVSDELILGVYAEENNQGQRLTTLHSGAVVETLNASGEFTQVRLSDGTMGWVKSSFLTLKPPAVVRIKQLEEELDRSRATTPGLTEDGVRSEVAQLQRTLADRQAELDTLRGGLNQSKGGFPALGWLPAAALPWISLGGIGISLLLGFWLGYHTLAKRVRAKFGGLKVY